MSIAQGDRLPDATLIKPGKDGPEPVALSDLTAGRKIVIFAVPGAFTPTCHNQHVPSFIAARDELAEKGVDAVYCIAVNDPFVMGAWGEATGGTTGGIDFLSDGDGSLTKALGLDFDAPPAGLHGRSRRYAMIVEDGVVTTLNIEESPGVVHVSGGDKILAAL